jgi:hypothetical protein
LTPATPTQIPKGPALSTYAPPPAKAFQAFTDDPMVEEICGLDFEGAPVDWLYLFNVGVKKLAMLLGAEICHKVVNYQAGHTYVQAEFDILVDVFRDLVIEARKCDEIHWKYLNIILDLCLSRKATFSTIKPGSTKPQAFVFSDSTLGRGPKSLQFLVYLPLPLERHGQGNRDFSARCCTT